ncbi:DUF6113 family protein [Microbacterium sp. zg.Y625]|nr:DUF6113 family protein [Microbacterium sp. zg-Y625]MCR2793129.1 DUF6113 family protein [Microbacterium sp. zg.Y625]MCR2814229.1 DUF6113 family protein [Microbacterium sp. zg.Y843]WIM26923.1 DUF6113 family protein [Microbacterium sp. zg-Y625]
MRARVLTWIIAVVVGFVYGVAGTVAHSYALGWFPLGLVLSIVGVSALLLAVRLLTADRWVALAAGIGAMVATLLFSGAGPGGSVIVPAPTDGMLSAGVVWTIAVPLVVAVVVAWPDLSRLPDRERSPRLGE